MLTINQKRLIESIKLNMAHGRAVSLFQEYSLSGVSITLRYEMKWSEGRIPRTKSGMIFSQKVSRKPTQKEIEKFNKKCQLVAEMTGLEIDKLPGF